MYLVTCYHCQLQPQKQHISPNFGLSLPDVILIFAEKRSVLWVLKTEKPLAGSRWRCARHVSAPAAHFNIWIWKVTNNKVWNIHSDESRYAQKLTLFLSNHKTRFRIDHLSPHFHTSGCISWWRGGKQNSVLRTPRRCGFKCAWLKGKHVQPE